MSKSKACARLPKKNVFVEDLKHGTKITDCGHLFVAGTGRDRAVVYWTGQGAGYAQRRLNTAARRGSW